MKRYEFITVRGTKDAEAATKNGWTLITVQGQSYFDNYFHFKRRKPVDHWQQLLYKVSKWLGIAFILALSITACSKTSVIPDGSLPGYTVQSLSTWLKSGFPLDTSMMFYQYPDNPVVIKQGVIDCYTSGVCQPMSYSIYVPDSIYHKYVKP